MVDENGLTAERYLSIVRGPSTGAEFDEELYTLINPVDSYGTALEESPFICEIPGTGQAANSTWEGVVYEMERISEVSKAESNWIRMCYNTAYYTFDDKYEEIMDNF